MRDVMPYDSPYVYDRRVRAIKCHVTWHEQEHLRHRALRCEKGIFLERGARLRLPVLWHLVYATGLGFRVSGLGFGV